MRAGSVSWCSWEPCPRRKCILSSRPEEPSQVLEESISAFKAYFRNKVFYFQKVVKILLFMLESILIQEGDFFNLEISFCVLFFFHMQNQPHHFVFRNCSCHIPQFKMSIYFIMGSLKRQISSFHLICLHSN